MVLLYLVFLVMYHHLVCLVSDGINVWRVVILGRIPVLLGVFLAVDGQRRERVHRQQDVTNVCVDPVLGVACE